MSITLNMTSINGIPTITGYLTYAQGVVLGGGAVGNGGGGGGELFYYPGAFALLPYRTLFVLELPYTVVKNMRDSAR